MKTIFTAITFLLLLVACNKSHDNDDTITDRQLEGPYTGTFFRTGMDTVNVSLRFTGNRFEGNSERFKYPALCGGSFSLDESTISFTDSCSWTADFDWTLILNGTYNIQFNSNETVRMWRTNGTVTDEYLIKRPFR